MGKNKQIRKEENRKAQAESNMKAVTEYEKKLEVIQDQINKISLKIASCQKNKRISDLSKEYIANIPETANLYSSMGKSFLLDKRASILEHLETSARLADEELPRLSKTYSQFDKLKKEQLDSIKELYDSIKAPARSS